MTFNDAVAASAVLPCTGRTEHDSVAVPPVLLNARATDTESGSGSIGEDATVPPGEAPSHAAGSETGA